MKAKKLKGMFFTIKFIEYACYKNIEDSQKIDENGQKMSKAGSSKEKDFRDILNRDILINPDCPIGIIRDYISNVVGLKGIDFDLSNDKAKVLQTIDADPSTCGLEFFKVKELYYIVWRRPVDQTSEFQYIPLLNPYSKEFIEFCGYQKKRSSIESRKTTGSYRGSNKDNDTIKSSISERKSQSRSAK